MEGITLFICSVAESVSHAKAIVEGGPDTNNLIDRLRDTVRPII
jgi:hypothetical protein